MRSYIIKAFERRSGTTVRNGLPEFMLAASEEVPIVQRLREEHPELFREPIAVEVWDETRTHLIWESHPDD